MSLLLGALVLALAGCIGEAHTAFRDEPNRDDRRRDDQAVPDGAFRTVDRRFDARQRRRVMVRSTNEERNRPVLAIATKYLE